MSFGKRKNPLIDATVDERFTDFHITQLEGRLRGEPFVAKCGCTYTGYGRGRGFTRCPQHQKAVDEAEDTKK